MHRRSSSYDRRQVDSRESFPPPRCSQERLTESGCLLRKTKKECLTLPPKNRRLLEVEVPEALRAAHDPPQLF